MDLNGVRLFVRVIEAGSFTKAAGDLGFKTSSVSRALTRLEDGLRVRLLHRTTRRLSLTAAGRIYFDQVKGALARIDEASMIASQTAGEPHGVVRMTAPPSMAGPLIPMIARFLRQHPQVRVEMSFAQRIVDLIEENVDLAVRIGRLRDSSLIARRVGTLRGGLFASREYIRRRGQPQRLADLSGHDCILFRSQGGTAIWHLCDGRRTHAVKVRGPLAVDEIPSAHQAVVAGVGIGSISFFVQARLPGLVRVLPEYVSADIPVSVVSVNKRLEPARVSLLRDFLAAQLAALPWNG